MQTGLLVRKTAKVGPLIHVVLEIKFSSMKTPASAYSRNFMYFQTCTTHEGLMCCEIILAHHGRSCHPAVFM